MPEEIALSCERCGKRSPLGPARAGFSFCLDCEFTVCAACWDRDAARCRQCASAVVDRDATGTPVARRALLQLSALVRELEEVEREARGGGHERADADIRWPFGLTAEIAMLEISAHDLWRAAQIALDESRSRDHPTADELGLHLDDTLEDVQRHLAQATLAVQQSARRSSRVETRTRWQPGSPRMGRLALGASAVAVLLVFVAIAVGLTRVGQEGGSGARLSGTSSAAPGTANDAVVGRRSSRARAPSAAQQLATFDDLRMDSRLGDGWHIDGDQAAVRVAPMPNAVDRSLELSPSGADATTVCRSAGPAPTPPAVRIAVDFMAATPHQAALAVTGRANRLDLSVYGPKRKVPKGAAVQRVDGGRWYRSLIRADADGWQWELTDLAADRRVLPMTRVPGSVGSSIDWFCVSLKASPGTELYVDDLTMSAAE